MTARRLIAFTLLACALPLTGSSLRAGGRSSAPDRALHPTVEPTLPALVEMRFESVERGPNEHRARLIVVVTAGRALRDVEIALVPPTGGARVDAAELPREPFDMSQGESRTFSLPVRGPARRDLPVRLTATFHTEGGKALHLGQGATLRSEATTPGRSHLGAWEVEAVPLEVVRP